MAISNGAALKGVVKCLGCMQTVEWDAAEDLKICGGNYYIVCPECESEITIGTYPANFLVENTDGEEEIGG